MTDIRPNVVSLLLDVVLDRDAFASRTMLHDDGRPVTDAEYELIGSARAEELAAMLQISQVQREMYESRARDVRRSIEIMQPYFDRFGPDTVVGDILKLCTAEERKELDEIFARTSPDGYMHLTDDPLAVND